VQLRISEIPEYIAGFLDCRNGIGEKYMQVLFHTKYSERKDPIEYLVILYTNSDVESPRYCQKAKPCAIEHVDAQLSIAHT
jgi:hypothetical protein